MRTTSSIFVIALVFASMSAQAQIVSIGQFAGSLNDDFEGYPNYTNGGNYSNLAVMGGGATFSAPTAQMWIYDPANASWGLGGYGSANVTSGHQGMGLYDNLNPVDVTLTFSAGVTRFGGFMATDSNQNGDMTLAFYDAANVLMGSDTIDSGSNAMQWYGWQSNGNAIAYIKFGNNWAPVMDDITADPVPEPATLLVLGAGLGALVRRRRA